MRLALAAVLLTSTMLSAQQPTSSPDSQPPVYKSHSSELVVLPVTVTDDDGRLVTDLSKADFTVFDEGRRQDIAAFSNEDVPVSIALVIDDSGSMRQKLGEVVAATLSFARWSHPEDELLVIEFNDVVRDALGGRQLTTADVPELARALHTLQPEGQTAVYDALMDAMDHLGAATHERRVIVLISDGADNASRATLDDVLERAKRSNVTIYAVGLFDDESRGSDRNPGVLKRLAETTGGARFLPKSPGPLLTACRQIAEEIRNSYTIGYVPPDRDGRFHRLHVEVTAPDRRGLKVRTRPGYVAADGLTQ
jgi:VWFA-related protein